VTLAHRSIGTMPMTPLVVMLRVKRAGTGIGCIYTICVDFVDVLSNITKDAVEVTVLCYKKEGR